MAKYRDIADDIRRRIMTGEYPVGSALPGLQTLASSYGAAVNTVRAAQEILRKEGLLRVSQGEPTTVLKAPAIDKASLLEKLRAIRTAVDEAIQMLEDSL